MKPLNVLIIDHDPEFALIVRELVDEKIAREVRFCIDGRRGLDELLRDPPDLLFIELIISKISGEQLIRFVRENREFSQTMVVAVSSVIPEYFDIESVGAHFLICKTNAATLKAQLENFLRLMESRQIGNGKLSFPCGSLKKRKVVQELLKYRSDINMILRNLKEGVILFDEDRRILQVNDAASAIAGKSALQLMCKTLEYCFGAETDKTIKAAFESPAKNSENGQVFNVEVDGKNLRLTIVRFFDDADFRFGAGMALIDDLTNMVETQKKLERKIRQLEVVNQATGFFNTSLSEKILFESLLTNVIGALDGDAGVVAITTAEAGEDPVKKNGFEIYYASGVDFPDVKGEKIEFDADRSPKHSFGSSSAGFSPRDERESYACQKLLEGTKFEPKSVARASIEIEGRKIGFVEIYGLRTEAFDEHDTELLTTIVQMASLYIRDAMLHKSILKQRDYYSDIMAHLSDGVMVLDRDRSIRYANRFFADFFGLPLTSIIGEKCYELFDCRDNSCDICNGSFDDIFQDGKKLSFQAVHKDANGSARHFTVSGVPLEISNGGVSTALLCYNDVTELSRLTGCVRASAQAASLLIREKNFRERIVEILSIIGKAYSSGLAIWYEFAPQNENSAAFRPAFAWRKSVDPGLERGNSFLDRFHDDGSLKRWKGLLSKGELVNSAAEELPDNERRFFRNRLVESVLAIPVIAREDLEGFFLLCNCAYGSKWRDVEVQMLRSTTEAFAKAFEQERTSLEKEELRKQLVRSQRMECMGELSSGMAHNFRNILAGIIANCQLILMKEHYDPEITALANGIKKLGFEGSELVGSLLRFSRKGEKYEQKVYNLSETLDETYKIVANSFDKKIRIRKDWPETLLVKGNSSMLYQVFMNMCTNARDAMPDGGYLEISARQENEATVVVISDTGVGMDEDTCEKIFTPFFTSKEKERGTGLGLSTAYGIVKEHGGDIRIYSRPGLGTTFKISFPIPKKEDANEKETMVSSPLKGKDQKILIVDDDEGFNLVTNKLLKLVGYTTFSALSGNEATEIYNEVEPDLVLLDRNMEGMDGVTTAEILLEIDPLAAIVFLSGYDQRGPDGISEELRDRIAGYISKPFELNELTRTIAEIFDRRRDMRKE